MVKIRVYLKKVEIGAEYENKIYDFWIKGKLQSGRIIDIFDDEFDLRVYDNNYLECLILATPALRTSTSVDLKGRFLGKHKIADDWLKWKKNLNLGAYFGMETEDGIFLLGRRGISKFENKEGEEISFMVVRFDLIAWHPIE